MVFFFYKNPNTFIIAKSTYIVAFIIAIIIITGIHTGMIIIFFRKLFSQPVLLFTTAGKVAETTKLDKFLKD